MMTRMCGTRKLGAAYIEVALSEFGEPVEYFLFDPAVPVDTQALGLSSVGVKPIADGDVTHVFDIIGGNYYPNVADIIEEVRFQGLSRRIPKTFPVELLSKDSRIVLLHRRGYIRNSFDYYSAMIREGRGMECLKSIHEHNNLSPQLGNPRSSIPEDPARFWSKVRHGPGCWEWTASTRNGYGQFTKEKSRKQSYAHRVSWELVNGPIPDGVSVCHRCDNKVCVRPDHLYLASHAENVRDARSRYLINDARGERASGAKLNSDEVSEIRHRHTEGESIASLAREFDVNESSISRIVSGEHWVARHNDQMFCSSLWYHDLVEGAFPTKGNDLFTSEVTRDLTGVPYRGWARPAGVNPMYQVAIIAALPIGNIAVVRDPVEGSHSEVLDLFKDAGVDVRLVDQ